MKLNKIMYWGNPIKSELLLMHPANTRLYVIMFRKAPAMSNHYATKSK